MKKSFSKSTSAVTNVKKEAILFKKQQMEVDEIYTH